MKNFLASTAVACLLGVTPALAIDQNTAVGIGVAKSSSTAVSGSSSVAIGGGVGVGVGGQGGNASSNANINGNSIAPSNTTNTNVISSVPANQKITTVPTVFAPGLAAAGIETCLGSISGGGSWLGTGISFGGTTPDPSCTARLDARTLWSFGLRKAAVSRLCINPDMANAMPDVCGRYLPRPSYAPAYSPAYAPAVQTVGYGGSLLPGQVWLTNGATNKAQICNDYDSAHKHCRRWVR
jgi:hypothetical protein